MKQCPVRQKKVSPSPAGVLACILLAVATLAGLACISDEASGERRMVAEDKPTAASQINGQSYADLQGTSCLPLVARIEGEIVWPLEISPQVMPQHPAHLAIHDDLLIVRYIDMLEVRDRTSGKRLWSKRIYSGVAFSLEPDGITTISHDGDYERLGFDGKVSERIGVPFLLGDPIPYFDLVRIDTDELTCIYHTYGEPALDHDEESIPPFFLFDRMSRHSEKGIWTLEIRGEMLGFRVSSDDSRVYMATDEYFNFLPMNAKSNEDVKSMEMPGLVTFSLNHADDLLVVQDTDEGRLLRQVGSDGQEQWQLELPKADTIWHPPASSPDGGVYLALGSKLLHIRNGKITWEYPFPSGGRNIYITVLSDGSVLAAAGIALVHISSAGEEIITKFLEHELTCRPIVDNDGRVYVGTKGGVLCLK